MTNIFPSFVKGVSLRLKEFSKCYAVQMQRRAHLEENGTLTTGEQKTKADDLLLKIKDTRANGLLSLK